VFEMGEVKIYRIKGNYRKSRRVFWVYKEIRALSKEKALEKFFSEIGRHGIKRQQLNITSIEEINPAEVKNAKIKKIITAEKPALYIED